MAISYPLSFPSALTVSSISIAPRNAVERSESPFTFEEQIYDLGGEMITISGTMPLMTREQAEAYVSFLFKLKGRRGTFLFPIPNSTPRGVATGTPLVDGAGQTGNSLNIKGMTVSTTNIFKAGDWLNLGTGSSTRLHKILDDANSDGAGKVTVNIWPSLRSSPADGAAITITNCKALLRLANDEGYSIDTNKMYFMQFSAMEAL